MTKEKVEKLRNEWEEAIRNYLIMRRDICNKIQEGGYSLEEALSSLDSFAIYITEAGQKRLRLERAEKQLKENK